MADPQRVPREDLMDPSVVPQSDRAPEPGALERFFKPLLPSTTLSDYWEGPKYALQHPLDSLSLLKDAVASDPAGAVPVVGNVKRGVQDVREGNYAGAAGEGTAAALSLLPFAKHVGVPNLSGVPGSIGRGVAAVGRGAEALGAATKKPALTLGALEGLINDPAKGAIVTGAPYAFEYGGRGLQRLGNAIEGLGGDRPQGPIVDPHMPNTSGYRPDGAFGEPAGNFQPTMADVDPHMANTSGYEPGSHSRNTTLRVGQDPLAQVDPHMANTSGYDPAGAFGDSAEGLYGSAADEAISRYMPNSGGADTAAVPRTAVAETEAGGGGMYGDVRGGTPDPTWGPGGVRSYTGGERPGSLEALERSLEETQNPPAARTPLEPNDPAPVAPTPTPTDGPAFTDWAAQMDDIINGATEGDMPKRASGFLSNSRPTKADIAGLDMLRRVNGAAGGVK